MRRSVERILTLRRRTVTHAWLERDEIRLGRDDESFFFSCPNATRHECCEPGPILLCMGLFSRFCVRALRCTAHSVSKTRVNALMSVSKTRVNALMRRCAASGTRDRWYFALTANRFNSNPSRSSAALIRRRSRVRGGSRVEGCSVIALRRSNIAHHRRSWPASAQKIRVCHFNKADERARVGMLHPEFCQRRTC